MKSRYGFSFGGFLFGLYDTTIEFKPGEAIPRPRARIVHAINIFIVQVIWVSNGRYTNADQ
jgi:hypothetical protein